MYTEEQIQEAMPKVSDTTGNWGPAFLAAQAMMIANVVEVTTTYALATHSHGEGGVVAAVGPTASRPATGGYCIYGNTDLQVFELLDAAGAVVATAADAATLTALGANFLVEHNSDGTHKYGPPGYLQGLGYEMTDTDEISINGGSVEINGSIYTLGAAAATAVQFSSLSADTWYYLYVEAPASGNALAAAQFSATATAPTRDHTKHGDWYDTTGNKRCIGFFLTDGSANILKAYINKGRYVPASFLTALAISGDNTTQTLIPVGLPALGRILAEYSGIVSHGSADYCWLYLGNGDDSTLNITNDILAGGRAGGASSYFGRGGSLDRLSDEDGKVTYKTSTGVDGAVIVIRTIALPAGMVG